MWYEMNVLQWLSDGQITLDIRKWDTHTFVFIFGDTRCCCYGYYILLCMIMDGWVGWRVGGLWLAVAKNCIETTIIRQQTFQLNFRYGYCDKFCKP